MDFEADTITKTKVFTKVACPKAFKLHCFQIVKKIRERKQVVPERPIVKRVAKITSDDVFANTWKFPVRKNNKTPACRWKDASNYTKLSFPPNKFNTGIPTGAKNNLLVVDIDVKDDGLAEFKKYITEHGDPNTLTVETPTGGYHYYFRYSHANPDNERMIKNYLKNASKYRGVGIDVRSEGGYVVAPPSIRDGKPYKIINNTTPADLPSELIKFLIAGKQTLVFAKASEQKQAKIHAPRKNIKFDISREFVLNLLKKLDDIYLHNYDEWLIATTVMKCHGFVIFGTPGASKATSTTPRKTKTIGATTLVLLILTSLYGICGGKALKLNTLAIIKNTNQLRKTLIP